jgi:hypothetical protein
LAAQQENAPNQPRPQRYYREYIHLPAIDDSTRIMLRRVFNEKSSRDWKLISATSRPIDNTLRLECDTLGGPSQVSS